MSRSIGQITVSPDGKGDYVLSIEDEDGETLDFTATYDDLDDLMDTIREAFNAEDDADLDDDEEDSEALDQ